MPVDIGIIGCGAATNRYYVPALKKLSNNIRNLYLVDTDIAQAEGVAASVGKGEVHEDYKKIIDRVHGAVIVIPHFLHYPVTMDFLRAGVNVLCEKPLAAESDQAKEMVETAAEHQTALCVNNTRRMFPNFKKIHEIISQGRIGKLRSIDYMEGGTFGWASATGFYVDPAVSSKGILLDLGPHVMDSICWWLGMKPKLLSFEDDSFGGPESVVRIKAESSDCEITVLLNRLVDLDSRFKIVGENGTIEGKPMDWQHIKVSSANGRREDLKLPSVSKNYPGFIVPVFENFLQVLEKQSKPLISGSDVLNSIDLIDLCYRSRRRFSMPLYDDLPVSENTSSGKVLVTGASGFIGGRVAEMLHLTGKRHVKAAINRWSSAARIGRFPLEIVQMDLMDTRAIEKALEGVTDIVHCAKGEYDVTVQGTKNLLDAVSKKGLKRFVHLSTTEVYGNVSGEIDEKAPLQYTGNEYNRMKVDAEKICWNYMKKGFPITILRPSIVYGPYSKSWTLHFAKMMIAGKWGILDGIGDGKCNLVFVDDLANVALLALDSEKATGEAFNIVCPDIITWNEYFGQYNRSLGLKPLETTRSNKVNMKSAIMQPVRIMGGFAKDHFMGPLKKVAETFEFVDNLMRRTESVLKSTPHPDELALYSRDVSYLAGKAKDLLNYQPLTDTKTGLNLSAEWVRRNGLL